MVSFKKRAISAQFSLFSSILFLLLRAVRGCFAFQSVHLIINKQTKNNGLQKRDDTRRLVNLVRAI
jgi:hypothetical protein